jgi:hypothetical protein
MGRATNSKGSAGSAMSIVAGEARPTNTARTARKKSTPLYLESSDDRIAGLWEDVLSYGPGDLRQKPRNVVRPRAPLERSWFGTKGDQCASDANSVAVPATILYPGQRVSRNPSWQRG